MTSTTSKVFFLWLLVLTTALGVATAQLTTPDGRIVGGWETSIAYFPHQVSLQIINTHICGASIIGTDLVLTAAHCVARYSNPDVYTIRAGSTLNSQGGVTMPVKYIRKHENYNKPSQTNNDIALLKLAMPLIFSVYIQPINLLQETMKINENEQFWVSGWGAQDSKMQQISPVLRYTAVNKIDLEKCRQAYKTKAAITENMLCAGMTQGGRDSCQGDSGGPLVARINNSVKLVGIVSFGYDCAKAQYPGVYTRVQNYNEWLNKTIDELK